MDSVFPCIKCNKNVKYEAVQCDKCSQWIHSRCAGINKQGLKELELSAAMWFCFLCKPDVWPFASLDNSELLLELSTVSNDMYPLYEKCKLINCSFSQYNDIKTDYDNAIDPESNFFNRLEVNCEYYLENQFSVKFTKFKGFSIVHFNARSLNANFEQIKLFLEVLNYKFDVIAFSETWLDSNCIDDYCLDNYNAWGVSRNKRGGGVAIYVHNSINHDLLKQCSYSVDGVLDCGSVELIMNKKKKVCVCSVYRPPNTDVVAFNYHMEKLLDLFKNKKLYLCGDFNVNLLNSNGNNSTNFFLETLYSNGLIPLITKPTRITNNSFTLIDNIFTSDYETEMQSGLLICDITDHLPVFVVCHCALNRKLETSLMKRDTRDTNMKEFYRKLSTVNWSTILECPDVNSAYNLLSDKITSIFDITCPFKKFNPTRKQNKPWLTPGLINATKKKRLLYWKKIKLKTVTAENRFKAYRNKLTAILRQAEKDYYSTLLNQHRSDIKKTWNIINNCIQHGKKSKSYPETFKVGEKLTNDPKQIANGFNNFFASIGPNLAKNIPESGAKVSDYINYNASSSFFLEPTCSDEIITVIKRFKNKTSSGYDGISMQTVKYISDIIAGPLAYIANLSFQTGTFPDNMKIAKIIPLFKSGDEQIYTNYRPVSLLPQFSKILEKLFNNRLQSYIEKNNIFYSGQYGFRLNHSTSLALIDLIENLTCSLDKQNTTIGIFVDLKKAFDTINHEILLEKLQLYGIRGTASSWVESYLMNRKQFVKFNEINSDFMPMVCGVPQGSILGPTLFLIYINDLCNASKILKFVLFADDTNVFYTDNNISSMCEIIAVELENLNKWFKANKLSLNVSKTNFIVFSKKSVSCQFDIKINGINIDRVYVTKFLGVLVDSKLNWVNHITYVQGKVAKSLSVMFKVKYLLNKSALYTLYCSLVLPYLNYCCEIWGNNYISRISGLIKLQKKSLRIIDNASRLAHTNELFIKYGILKFVDLVQINTGTLMYKARYKQLPERINQFFEINISNTRQQGNFKIRYRKTTRKQLSISVVGVRLWNNLDQKVKEAKDIWIFKSRFKRGILNKYQYE